MGYSYSDDPLVRNCARDVRVLCVDSPSQDHYSSDTKAAADNLVFVTRWLEAFPAYKNRPTWFTGESYGVSNCILFSFALIGVLAFISARACACVCVCVCAYVCACV